MSIKSIRENRENRENWESSIIPVIIFNNNNYLNTMLTSSIRTHKNETNFNH